MLLEMGRPSDCTGRLPREVRVYELLDRLRIPYLRADHPAAMTMEACAEVDRALEADICKNLLLCNRQRTAFYLLLLPGSKVFKTSLLSKQIGSSRLSFAQGEDMERLLDTSPGSLSIMGLMNDPEGKVQLLIDRDVLREPYFGCHPCMNTSTLRMETTQVTEVLIPALQHPPMLVTL